MLQLVTLPALQGTLPLGLVARTLGAHRGRGPFHSGKTWPDHLAWGLDSTVAAVRLMLCLQPIGAAVVARTQLERWSSNVEFNSTLAQATNESTADWYDRLWNSDVVRASQGVERVGTLYALLSEALHGRGDLMNLVWLDAVDIHDVPGESEVRSLAKLSDVLLVCMGRLRTCLTSAAADAGADSLARLATQVQLVGRCASWMPAEQVGPFVYPLTPFVFQQRGARAQTGAVASAFERVMRSLEKAELPDDPVEAWPLFAFGEHRARALAVADLAYRRERELLGREFDEHGIDQLMPQQVLASELAGVLAGWLRDDRQAECAAAFAVCASALRSAFWLWLEDDSRAMGCLRCVIEQLARVRTWRTHPDRARRLELTPRTTPRDWVEAAGWRRLGLVNRALGEFAHGSTAVNWEVARQALVAVQPDAHRDDAQFTGRTYALTLMIHLVTSETSLWLDRYDSGLGAAFRSATGITESRADQVVEELMRRTWLLRQTPVR